MSLLRNVIPTASSAIVQADQSHVPVRQNTQQQIAQKAVTSGQAVIVALSASPSGKKRAASHGDSRRVDSTAEKQEIDDKKSKKEGKSKVAPSVNISA